MESERTTQATQYLEAPQIHDEWSDHYLNPNLESFYEQLFDQIKIRLNSGGAREVLDAGCGTCMHGARLVRRGFDLTGVDFSPAALANADEFLKKQGLAGRIRLVRGNLLELPFEDESFDAVMSFGVLMHVPEVERALRELTRVTRRNGRLVLKENNAASVHVRLWEPLLHVVKRALGRPVPRIEHSQRGVEGWHEREGGGLMVRKVNIPWLVQTLEGLGMHLVDRLACQFTELYTSVPGPLKRPIYWMNEFYSSRGLPPDLAMGNILVFERRVTTLPPPMGEKHDVETLEERPVTAHA